MSPPIAPGASLLKHLSLRTTIIVPYTLIIATAVGLVIWLSWQSGQTAVYDLSGQIRQEVTAHVHQHLEHYMAIPPQVNQMNLDAYQVGLLDLHDFERIGNLFARQQSMYGLSFVNFGGANSAFIGAGQVGDHREIVERSAPLLDGVHIYTIDAEENRGEKLYFDPGANPNAAPWYTDAVAAGKPIWSPIYSWADIPDVVAISSSFPVYDQQQSLVGVLGVDFFISDLGSFLKTVHVGQTGEIFIIERSGLMVASSSDAPSFKLVNGQAEQLSAVESDDPLIHGTARYLVDHFGSYANIQAATQLDYMLQNQRQFVQVAPFQDAYGLDWLIVVVVPEADFMGRINANAQTTILLALAALAVAVLVGVFTANWVMKPLSGLSAAALKISEGDWDVSTLPSGYTNEIGKLAYAFRLMVERLKATLESLEQRVVERTADLQQANQELTLARQAAEAANHAKTTFLANMSHELRTPLNAIINFTKFLSKERYGALTERQTELQQRVLFNADHLLGLINDILDLAKIESGKMELQRESADLLPLLHGVMATAIGLTKDKGLALELDTPEQLPLALIDKSRVRQVLLNLLSNAAKFTREGGITVRAAVVAAMVQVEVQDTGIGIAPEHLEQVFEEFQQVQSDLQREYQGTGLGLPISRRLIELHGGRLWVESAPGAGSTFRFTVPLAAPAPRPRAELPVAQGDERGAPVVVVDDDPEAQQILRECLAPLGCQIYPVLDSQLALATIRRVQPRLVILDIMMAHPDGWELLLQLRHDPELAAIPVIISSVVDQPERGLALGANDYLVKPIDETRLQETVRRWLNQPATVLVIDDNADARAIVMQALEGEHRVIEAPNGLQGLALTQMVRPDLVVLDLMLPEMDGFAVLERLRADPATAEVPVVVVTAKDLTPQERVWLRERAQALSIKGQLTAEALTTVLEQYLRKDQ